MVEGRWRRLAKQIVDPVVDAVLPPRCLACDVDADDVNAIVGNIEQARGDGAMLCRLCRDQLAHSDEAAAYFAYGGVLADLVRRAKYHHDLATALGLAELFAAAVEADDSLGAVDVVTYVPAPWTRVVARGFDLPALMAERAAERLGRPWAGLLRAQRRDARLANAADAEARARLVAGRFVVTQSSTASSWKRVLLVDDVVTTGATSVEATGVLAADGRDVVIRCLAQTPRAGDDGGGDDDDDPGL